jgi:hypothetical protein
MIKSRLDEKNIAVAMCAATIVSANSNRGFE